MCDGWDRPERYPSRIERDVNQRTRKRSSALLSIRTRRPSDVVVFASEDRRSAKDRVHPHVHDDRILGRDRRGKRHRSLSSARRRTVDRRTSTRCVASTRQRGCADGATPVVLHVERIRFGSTTNRDARGSRVGVVATSTVATAILSHFSPPTTHRRRIPPFPRHPASRPSLHRVVWCGSHDALLDVESRGVSNVVVVRTRLRHLRPDSFHRIAFVVEQIQNLTHKFLCGHRSVRPGRRGRER